MSTRAHAAAVTAAPSSIAVGARVTDYSSLDLTVEGMAAGGMGLVVWGPNAVQGGKRIAAKVLRPDLRASEALRAAFEREALIWCRLWPHRCVVDARGLTRLPDFGGLPILTLAYADGGTLRERLQRARRAREALGLAESLRWAQHIAAALAHLHAPDPAHERPDPVVHCDLKPENVLLARRADTEIARVSDLGLARAWAADGVGDADAQSSAPLPGAEHGEADKHDTVAGGAGELHHTRRLPATAEIGVRGPAVGTWPYMPPEQWQGIAAAVPASDVYALGVVLFELFAGVPGYPHAPTAAGPAGWHRAHLDGPTRRLTDPGVGALRSGPLAGAPGGAEALAELDALVMACLRPHAGERPTAARVQVHLGDLAERLGLPRERPRPFQDSPDNEAIYWSNLGITYTRLSRPEKAIRLHRRAVAAGLGDVPRYVNLGTALVLARRFPEALEAFDAAARYLAPLAASAAATPEEGAVLRAVESGRGQALMGLKRHEEAVEALRRAAALDPDNPGPLQWLAHAYSGWAKEALREGRHAVALERIREAVASAREACRLAPQNATLAELRGQLEAALQRAERAHSA